MLSHKKSLDILKKTNALLEGHFVLSSGLHSSKYIQCAKLLSYPHKADLICKSLAQKIKKNFNKIDLILIMSVNPGKGGQKFKESTFQRLKLLKQKIIDSKLETKIEVDGGIDNSVSKKLNNLGADILVSGSYLIKNDSIKKGVNSLLKV